MKNNFIKSVLAITAIVGFAACNPMKLERVVDPNNPSLGSVANNASRAQIQFLITGLESRHRDYLFTVTAAFGTFGREIWYFNASDPRFQTDWLGQGGRQPDAAYFGFGATGGAAYATPYQTIRQAIVLRNSVLNTAAVNEQEKKAVTGFAKTIMGYQFMIPANFLYENGIRINVEDPMKPGPFVPYQDALTYIKGILDEGLNDLNAAGTSFPFNLTAGWAGFNTIEGLKRVNRAIAARLAVYRKDWEGALNAANASFMSLAGDLNTGPAHVYGAAPDAFNPLFYVLNANISTVIVVHPSMIADARPGDLRVANKFFQRASAVSVSTDAGTLFGSHQDRRWPTNITPIRFIRNEELVLIKAEAHAQLNQFSQAVQAIDTVRVRAGIGSYTGAQTQAALINEILYQRRYSLWAEPWGHRWIDTRRYDRMNEIPVTLDGGRVFRQFPKPQADLNWNLYVGG
ncbi:MAG: RagB/SusD family nutrient uptake outer membrane protein [Bacteroidetes bacterium]|nr:RagB/SusD family nutrient uptake outer membrane protein [Bacteroidota bacterium]